MDVTGQQTIATNPLTRLGEIRSRVRDAEMRAGRAAGSVRLIGVTKTVEAVSVEPLIEAGLRDFGENRMQEAKAKWPPLRRRYPDLRLHLIGPLQSNKVRDAVALFDSIHSLDRDKIAAALGAEMVCQGRSLELFVQVNTGGEPQKAGILPLEADSFVERCRSEHGLVISGLTCIPPVDEPAALHFALLAKIARRLGLPRLSMGMSGDYETAIAFGATDIRIGTGIFGDRVATASLAQPSEIGETSA
jgi:pyridoxal phosphate enzyme (YggS family)